MRSGSFLSVAVDFLISLWCTADVVYEDLGDLPCVLIVVQKARMGTPSAGTALHLDRCIILACLRLMFRRYVPVDLQHAGPACLQVHRLGAVCKWLLRMLNDA